MNLQMTYILGRKATRPDGILTNQALRSLFYHIPPGQVLGECLGACIKNDINLCRYDYLLAWPSEYTKPCM